MTDSQNTPPSPQPQPIPQEPLTGSPLPPVPAPQADPEIVPPSLQTPPPPPPTEPPKKSFSIAFVVVGLLVVAGALLAGAYFMGYLPDVGSLINPPSPSPVVMPSPSPLTIREESSPPPLSKDDSIETIQKELDETTIGDFSEEFVEVEKEIEDINTGI